MAILCQLNKNSDTSSLLGLSYIYNGSTEHFNEAVTDADLLAICSSQNPETAGTLYDGTDEQHPLTVYRCIPEYHLLLTMEANAS